MLAAWLCRCYYVMMLTFVLFLVHMPFRARCTNVVHDLRSAEPRSRVEPSSRCIPLHQLELGSADLVQLNHRGYTVDDADWWSHAGQWAKHSYVTVTRNAYETVNYRLAIIFVWILSFKEVLTQLLHQQLHCKVLKIHILCSDSYLFIILRLLSRYMFTIVTL